MKIFRWFDYLFFLLTLPCFVVPYALSILVTGQEPQWIDRFLTWYFRTTR